MGTHLTALLAGVLALGVTAALTPLAGGFARLVRAVDVPSERGLAAGGVPLLGGLAILAGVLVASLLALAPFSEALIGILQAAVVITVVGALDDRFDLLPGAKLVGQIVAAVIAVRAGVTVDNITLPFLVVDFGAAGGPLTVLGLVAVMNIVNFSDGIDGLAAGIVAIAATAFAVVAFDLGRVEAGTLSAITAGAALGFFIFNFHPASIYMGDAGANLLGLLLGCCAVQGAVKTQALLSLVLPFVILAVPVLDTAFVVLKRLKYGNPVYNADREHFHHRLDRVGFSTRRTVMVLHAWTLGMAALAIALRFVPYSEDGGNYHLGWSLLMGALLLLALAASIGVVYVLEILKFERDGRRFRVRMGGPASARGVGETTDAGVGADDEAAAVAGAPPEGEADPAAPGDPESGAPVAPERSV